MYVFKDYSRSFSHRTTPAKVVLLRRLHLPARFAAWLGVPLRANARDEPGNRTYRSARRQSSCVGTMHQSSFEPHDSTRLSGSRPLTPREERYLVRHIRGINARDRALISAQMFLGFRISEVLALTVGHVLLNGQIRTRVALPPRFLKGRRGTTRSVPIGPELRRALERYLAQQARHADLESNTPLFPSPHRDTNGNPVALCRSSAEKIIKRALRRISPDPQGLSTHSLRKSWAVRLYEASGHDLLIVRDGLGHRSVAVTQVYLPTARSRVDELILQGDWTHRKPRAPKLAPISNTATPRAAGDKTAA